MSEPFGLLNVLKPPGMSSHDVVGAVRRLVGTRRVGHGGTLDPAAAGVMTVAVGKATRLLGYLRDDKAYRAEVVFGLATDSADAEGEVIASADASALTHAALEASLAAFRGTITQRPPMTSAVHVQGKRLYELARAGITLAEEEIPQREVTLHALDLVAFTPGRRAVAYLDVHCSAGTYIRSLAVDLGAALGLPACLGFLLRTSSGHCTIKQAQTLEEVAEAPRYLPLDLWLPHVVPQEVTAHEVEELRLGRRIPRRAEGETFRLQEADGKLVAIAAAVADALQPKLVF